MSVKVVVDSTADIPADRVRELDITVVPLLVLFGDESYRDGVDLDTDTFYAKLTSSKVTPTTSAPSPGAFEETYRTLIREGATGILQLCLSGDLSATYNTAVTVAGQVSGETGVPIEVVDSRSVSAGFGLPAQMVAREAREGLSLAELKARAENICGRVHVFAVLDTLEYLQRGGRIGSAKALAGTLLAVKPILEVRDGKVVPLEQVRTRSKAQERVGELAARFMPLEAIAVIGSDEQTRQQLADIAKRFWSGELNLGALGPVVGTHAGPAGGIVTISRE